MTTGTDKARGGLTRRDMLVAGATGTAGALLAPGSMVQAQAETGTATDAASVAPPASAAAASKAVSDAEAAIIRISREVWENAELGRQEMKSHAIHIRELEAEGFTITSRNTSGYPTAFIAEWTQGTGGPVIAYLPEYDALPGLGNAAEPRQTPGPTGVEVGHACGHNLIGAGCTGAAFALKRMMQADGTAGTVRVYGCASEESQGVKVYMVRDGLFADVDAALAWHPAPVAAVGGIRTAANNGIRISFHGKPPMPATRRGTADRPLMRQSYSPMQSTRCANMCCRRRASTISSKWAVSRRTSCPILRRYG
jgi:aminobenzoyl-glutamate utilization protein B